MKETKKVLVVDDEVHILHVVSLKLRNAGYEVITAPDGQEALEVAQVELPDLIITDYDMPEMTGLQLAEKVARTHPAVPVIVVTGRKAPVGMETQSLNIKKLIRKPYNKRSISIAIREVLDHDGIAMESIISP